MTFLKGAAPGEEDEELYGVLSFRLRIWYKYIDNPGKE